MKLTLLLLVGLSATQVSFAAPHFDITMICGSDEYKRAVDDIMIKYVFKGKIPLKEAMRMAEVSEVERYEMFEKSLRNNGLPPLPPCRD